MNAYETINDVLVNLFYEILDLEEKTFGISVIMICIL